MSPTSVEAKVDWCADGNVLLNLHSGNITENIAVPLLKDKVTPAQPAAQVRRTEEWYLDGTAATPTSPARCHEEVTSAFRWERQMRVGLDRLLRDGPRDYGRTGWLVNGSAVSSATFDWAPTAAASSGFEVTQLFAPEHGVHGAIAEAVKVDDHRDPWSGVPVCSLYSDGPAGTIEALDRCDTVIIDLPDNGTRYSTYLSTVADLLDAIATHSRPPRVVIADRPNLLGRRQEGPPLQSGFESIVGRVHVPARHGLTLGEEVRTYVQESGCGVDLDVVTVEGWEPSRMITSGPYLPPSPNLNSFDAQLLYVGTCLFEGTNLSEGRGTANPFQAVGAPWLDAAGLAAQLRKEDWPGVRIRATSFTPTASKHRDQLCNGVFIHLSDPTQARPLHLAVRLLELIFTQSDQTQLRTSGSPKPSRFLDRLWGGTELAEHLDCRSPRQFSIAEISPQHQGSEDVALYEL